MNRYYTGVGSRETPDPILSLMTKVAASLERQGYHLRSGGAKGADTAFEDGVKSDANKSIFLPWPGFNGRKNAIQKPTPGAVEMGIEYHPLLSQMDRESDQWRQRKTQTIAAMMGRNAHQVLGLDLRSPSAFLLCWTPDGADGTLKLTSKESGGTGQAIRIAAANKVKVINLQNPASLARLEAMLKKQA